MLSRRIAALIGIRILAVYSILQGLGSFPMIIYVYSRDAVVSTLAPLLTFVFFGIVLWFMADRLAMWIVKDVETQDSAPLDFLAVNRAFVSFLGLVSLTHSLPGL